jgi:demethylspheroidene O-methyltransferase
MTSSGEALADRLRNVNAGFWISRGLSSAVELGIVELLTSKPRSLADLSGAAHIDQRSTEALVRLLAYLGVAEWADDGLVRLTAAARSLVRDEPNTFTTEVPVDPGVWATFTDLTEVLRGRERGDAARYFARFSDRERSGFDATMALQIARAAPELVELLDLSGSVRLLDLGGGTGALGAAFARRWPHLHVLVFDLGAVAAPVSDPLVELQSGDFWHDAARRPFDVLVLSRVLHDWSDEDASRLLCRWVAHLPVGGRAILHEEMLGDTASHAWPVMVDLFLVACLGRGRVRTVAENSQMLADAGCEVLETRSLAGGTTAIAVERRN